MHGFELGDGIHDVGTLDAAGHVGRRSDTAPFRFAVVSVDDVAVCVAVINRCGSGKPHGAVDGARVRGTDVALSVGVFEVYALRQFQPFDRLEFRMEFRTQRLAPCVEQGAFLFVVGYREDRRERLAAAGNRHGIVLRQTRAEDFVEPVGAGDVGACIDLRVGQIGQRAARRVLDGLAPDVAELLRVEHRREVHGAFEADRYVDVDAGFTCLRLTCGDQNYTARTYRSTVNGGRGGIFQDGDRLDIFGHVGSAGDTVHNDQHAVARSRADIVAAVCGALVRAVVVALRAATADGERRFLQRVARLLDRNARHAALQEGSEIGGAAAGRIVHFDGGDGHREVLFTLRAVTDGNDFADHRGGFVHRDVDFRAVHDGQRLRFVADERKVDHAVRFHGNLVAAVGIGGDAVGRALFYDRSADERSLAAVGQLSGHRDPILRMGRKNEYAQQQTHQKKADEAPVLLRSCQIHFHRVKVNINSNCVERLGNSRFWQIFI